MSTVSIILPTYNREAFLPEAFAAIRTQTFLDWELIVVDDGSTDGTRELVAQIASKFAQRVRYIYQENQGAYGARNTGLDHASGRYIAFYDSDDIWLPHHLQKCVAALEGNPDVDWVYGACRVVDYATGEEIAPSTFYVNGRSLPFLRLKTRKVGALCIVDDPGVLSCMLVHGTYNGLQNSVIRSCVFDEHRFEATSRNEAEDQLAVVRALAAGCRIAYFDDVHVIYRVHGANSSAIGNGESLAQKRRLIHLETYGYERALWELPLRPDNARAYRRRLFHQYFWKLGYALYWEQGRKNEALEYFRKGLSLFPLSAPGWKTYLLSLLRTESARRVSRLIDCGRQCWWYVSDASWRRAYRDNMKRIGIFRKRQRNAVERIVRTHGAVVMTGPFQGMRFPLANRASTYCGHVLLGTYELELAATIDEICQRNYSTIVDVGASEGYYVAGLALRNPTAYVLGFEADTEKHCKIHEVLQANSIRNVEVRGFCDAEDLRALLRRCRKVLLLVDIDGGELNLLNPTLIGELAGVDILVETHDIICPGILKKLMDRFAGTHEIISIETTARRLSDLPASVALDAETAQGAMDEFRGGRQVWLWMTARIGAKSNQTEDLECVSST
jgi:glycosyltransferase involved in cell wall biosynthesis